jgi:hypothetical protein
VWKRKIHSPCRESNPGRPSRSLVDMMTELPRLLLTCSRWCFILFIIFMPYVTCWMWHENNEEHETLKRNPKIDFTDGTGLIKQRNPSCQNRMSKSEAVLKAVLVFSSCTVVNVSLNENNLPPANSKHWYISWVHQPSVVWKVKCLLHFLVDASNFVLTCPKRQQEDNAWSANVQWTGHVTHATRYL